MANELQKMAIIVGIDNVTVDKGILNKDTIPGKLLLEIETPIISYEELKENKELNEQLEELIEEELMNHLEVDYMGYKIDVVDFNILYVMRSISFPENI